MSNAEDQPAATAAAPSRFELTVRLVNGTRFSLPFPPGNGGTVLDVKRGIEALRNEHSLPVDQQRLIYKGRILDDDSKTLRECGIESASTVFLVKKSPAAAAAASRMAPTTATTSGAVAAAAAPLPAATTAAASSAGGDWMSQFLQQQQQQQQRQPGSSGAVPPLFPPDSGMFSQQQQQQQQNGPITDNPMLRSLADNPEMLARILRMQFDSNPQLQQLLEQQPHLRQILEDPSMIEQMAQMLRHPQAMQQAMRQQDLALSQLENMPGGFAALSSMYHQISEPLQDSMSPGDGGGNDSGGGPGGSSRTQQRQMNNDAGAAGTAMPNPWGSPPSSSSSNVNRNANRNSNSMNPFGFPMTMMPPQGPSPASGTAASQPSASSPNNFNPWANLPPSTSSAVNANNNNNAHSAAPNPSFPIFPGAGGLPSLSNTATAEQALRMLEDPAFAQMMQNMVEQNPDSLREMLQLRDPTFARMFANNPEAGNQFVRTMCNPQMLRTMVEMQRNMSQQLPGTAAGSQPPQFPPMDPASLFGSLPGASLNSSSSPAGPAASGGIDLGALLRQAQQAASIPTQQLVPGPPQERFRRQLQSLADMGFVDEAQNIAVLEAVSGNLNRAIDRLLMDASSGGGNGDSMDTATGEDVTGSGTASSAADEGQRKDGDETTTPPPKDADDKKND